VADRRPRPEQLLGVALVSMASLMLEIVLTRVFSVTMWYHFAFLAVSLALLGSALGGLFVYFRSRTMAPERAWRLLGVFALCLAILVPLTFALYLKIPFVIRDARGALGKQAGWLVLIILDLMVPFFLSGATASLALSVWPSAAGQVYWADLSGAALGCMLSIVALDRGGAQGAVLTVAVLAALGGLVFSLRQRRLQRAALVVAGVLLVLLISTGRLELFSLGRIGKLGAGEPDIVWQKWNSQSRVTVHKPVNYPFFWATTQERYEEVSKSGNFLGHALLLIDAVAGTPIQEFHGDLSQVAFLGDDLTSFVYRITDAPRTLVIGPGGGRDVLAALAVGAPQVVAVEVNPAVAEAMLGPFADYAGHLYERQDVIFAVDDARGYIARSPDRYDVIQASLIDTWAAGASGAFALSENSLYTQEAFKTYYDHLTENGMLSVSRWYFATRPAETLRLVSTGMAGWELAGVADPSQHVIVVMTLKTGSPSEGLSTVLFKRSPFTPQEVAKATAEAKALGFEVLYAPGAVAKAEVGEFIEATDRQAWIARYPLDISPATDDRPFFFNLARFGDLFVQYLQGSGVTLSAFESLRILLLVTATTLSVGALLIIVPLVVGGRRRGLGRPPARLLIYFGLLGVSFMLVEVPTIQRLTVYLGRPVYALAIVLFGLLLFGGLGSLISGRWQPSSLRRRMPLIFALLVVVIGLQIVAIRWLLPATMAWRFRFRFTFALLLVAPLGILLGMPFPTGIRVLSQHYRRVVAWVWGINGVTSVLGSALATALGIHVGFSLTLVIAAALYVLAGTFLWQELGA